MDLRLVQLLMEDQGGTVVPKQVKLRSLELVVCVLMSVGESSRMLWSITLRELQLCCSREGLVMSDPVIGLAGVPACLHQVRHLARHAERLHEAGVRGLR
jgi:hypothetical protein